MKNISFIIAVLIFVLSTFVFAQPHEEKTTMKQIEKNETQQSDKEAQAAFAVLIAAIEANDYASFVTPLDNQMKEALTKPAFEMVVAQFASRLKKGCEAKYFGELKTKGYAVHLWKLTFKDQGDDVLAELSMKDKKVGGFFLR